VEGEQPASWTLPKNPTSFRKGLEGSRSGGGREGTARAATSKKEDEDLRGARPPRRSPPQVSGPAAKEPKRDALRASWLPTGETFKSLPLESPGCRTTSLTRGLPNSMTSLWKRCLAGKAYHPIKRIKTRVISSGFGSQESPCPLWGARVLAHLCGGSHVSLVPVARWASATVIKAERRSAPTKRLENSPGLPQQPRKK